MQESGLVGAIVGIEETKTRDAEHVQQNTVNVQHESTDFGAIKIPQIEGVSKAAVGLMVDLNVGGGEVPRHISEKQAQQVLKRVSERRLNPFLVESGIMPLCKHQREFKHFVDDEGMRTSLWASAYAAPMIDPPNPTHEQ